MELVSLINSSGLDAKSVLGNVNLGLNANPEDFINVFSDVLSQVVERAGSMFSSAMGSSVAPVSSSGQIAQQSVYNNSPSNSITINAQYPMQSARSASDDLQMWTMLTGNSAA